ncbi:hypothetical protein ACH5RR_016607 [Cinchona calisaya]|uniref:Peptidase C1A papain C-terminal domain-containing protein n=1 Tax=Cinchona calisaya TaxID=153742 RepID=A0ABD3A208_9GENT
MAAPLLRKKTLTFVKGLTRATGTLTSLLSDSPTTPRKILTPTALISRTAASAHPYSRFSRIPVNHSWRKYGIIGEVQDQGREETCFPRAVLGLVESEYARRGVDVKLSLQEIVDNVEGYEGVYEWLIKNGVSSEQEYRAGEEEQDPDRDIFYIDEFRPVEANEDALIQTLLERPVVAAIRVGLDFLTYEGGILREEKVLRPDPTVRHAVQIVGFGEEGKHKYFEVKNSYGRDWGEDGYIRISRDHNGVAGVLELYDNITYPVLHASAQEILGQNLRSFPAQLTELVGTIFCSPQILSDCSQAYRLWDSASGGSTWIARLKHSSALSKSRMKKKSETSCSTGLGLKSSPW